MKFYVPFSQQGRLDPKHWQGTPTPSFFQGVAGPLEFVIHFFLPTNSSCSNKMNLVANSVVKMFVKDRNFIVNSYSFELDQLLV